MALSLWFLNVGYGDAIYAEATPPGGRPFRMLMDGGSAHKAEQTRRFLAERGVRKLDLMVSTHLHEDHVAGLAIVAAELEALGEFWSVCPVPDNAADVPVAPEWAYFTRKTGESLNAYRKLLHESLPRLGARVRTVVQGDLTAGLTFEPQPGVKLELLSTGGARTREIAQLVERLFGEPDRVRSNLEAIDQSSNDACLVIRLKVGRASALLTGDATLGWAAGVPESQLRADLLKLGHHGNADATDQSLVRAVAPKAAVVSAGQDRTDRPEPAVLQALENIPVYRSEQQAGSRWLKAVWDEDASFEICSDVPVGSFERE